MDKTSRLATGMGATLVGMGILHFAVPKPFNGLIPPELPGSPTQWTYASGAAELAVGTGLLIPATRRTAATAAVGLFAAVLPGNLQMVRLWWPKPLPYKAAALARIPMQIPMIQAALAVRRGTPPRN